MTVGPDTVVQRSTEIMHSDLGDQTVMMDLDAGAYYGLNEVGSRIWALTEHSTTLRDVVDRLLEEFDIGREECEEAVQSFVSDLIEADIVIVAAPS